MTVVEVTTAAALDVGKSSGALASQHLQEASAHTSSPPSSSVPFLKRQTLKPQWNARWHGPSHTIMSPAALMTSVGAPEWLRSWQDMQKALHEACESLEQF